MRILSERKHKEALVRRRIKFVVEKGAMARLFKAGSHSSLQDKLYEMIKPSALAAIRDRKEYDSWLIRIVEADRWAKHSRNGLVEDRWAYFAKLINIVIYEIVSNRELFAEADWERLRPNLHIPIDSTVMDHLSEIDPNFPVIWTLKGMTKKDYLCIQQAVRMLAKKHDVPPIWFEAIWSI